MPRHDAPGASAATAGGEARSRSGSRSRCPATSPTRARPRSAATSSGPSVVNAHGGMLGRKVQLKIVDDASSPNQVVTNYQNLINARPRRPRLRPVLDAADGAGRAGRQPLPLRVRRAGRRRPGGVRRSTCRTCSSCSRRRSSTAATRSSQLHPLAAEVAAAEDRGVPVARRPVLLADRRPHAEPVRGGRHQDRLQDHLPARDHRPDADRREGRRRQARHGRRRHAVRGRLRPGQGDGPAEVQPEVPVPLERRQLADRVPEQGRRAATSTGSSAAATGSRTRTRRETRQFIAAYLKKYGGNAFGIDSGSAEAYAVGQLIQAVAKKTGSIDNETIIKTLHSGTWPTIEGNLSWDENGSPEGQRHPRRVDRRQAAAGLPGERRARTSRSSPKPAWKG